MQRYMTIEQIANNNTHYEHAKHKHYNHKNCSTCYTTNQHLPDYETSMAKMNLKNKKYAGDMGLSHYSIMYTS